MPSGSAKKRVLAIASGGGHWVQMMRLRPAFEGTEIHFAGTDPDSAATVAPAPFHHYTDANRDTKLQLIATAFRIAMIVLKLRPHVIVSTGAAPGYLAIRVGNLIGARTMFIDSIANAEALSMSADMSGRHADKLLTQWPNVAEKTGAEFHGAVL